MSSSGKKIIYKSAFLALIVLLLVVPKITEKSTSSEQLRIPGSMRYEKDALLEQQYRAFRRTTYEFNAERIPDSSMRMFFSYIRGAESYTFQCGNKKSEEGYYFSYSVNDKEKGIYDITDNSPYGSGEYVKYCKSEMFFENAGVILGGLSSQGNNKEFKENLREINSLFDVFIVPRIRIDSLRAADLYNGNMPVCEIRVYNSSGDTIMKENLLVRNFYERNKQEYHGNYVEFYNIAGIKSNYRIPTRKSEFSVQPYGQENSSAAQKNISAAQKNIRVKVKDIADMEIYWYGYVDMWIDYIKIENEPAYSLLSLQESITVKRFRDMISEVVF